MQRTFYSLFRENQLAVSAHLYDTARLIVMFVDGCENLADHIENNVCQIRDIMDVANLGGQANRAVLFTGATMPFIQTELFSLANLFAEWKPGRENERLMNELRERAKELRKTAQTIWDEADAIKKLDV